MKRIKVLPEQIISNIKAGEVIERPSSIVKEITENSIDALAHNIFIELRGGGKKLVKIVDDGTGIMSEDIPLAFLRHSTSKISRLDDIYNINSFGFRGEALASIALCSYCSLSSKTRNEELGTRIIYDFGKLVSNDRIPMNEGTVLEIKDIFQKIPPRKKYLKSDYREKQYIYSVFNSLAMVHNNINFRLLSDNNEVFFYEERDHLIERILDVLGLDEDDMLHGVFEKDHIKLELYLPKENSKIEKVIRNHIYINRRFVKVPLIIYIMKDLMASVYNKNQNPFFLFFLDIEPGEIDVNAHPQKLEIRMGNINTIIPFIKESFFSLFNKHYANTLDVFTQKREEVDYQPEKRTELKENLRIYDNPGIISEETEEAEGKTQGSLIKNHLKIIGQVFNSYIIAEIDEKILLIDQHALFEEYRYEQLMHYYKNHDSKYKLGLINPIILDIGIENIEIIEEFSNIFEKLGFEMDVFSKTSIIIRYIPYILKKGKIDLIINEIINYLKYEQNANIDKHIKSAISLIACHSSLRGNYELTWEHQKILIDIFYRIQIPKCPHNRPIFIELSHKDIETLFRRRG